MFNSRTTFGTDRDAFVVSTVDHDNDTFRTTWWSWRFREGEIHEFAIVDTVSEAVRAHTAACTIVADFEVGE